MDTVKVFFKNVLYGLKYIATGLALFMALWSIVLMPLLVAELTGQNAWYLAYTLHVIFFANAIGDALRD